MYKSTCLKQSLVLYHFLRGLGIDVDICFGVRYKDQLSDGKVRRKLEGHAWLLHNGEVFQEKDTFLAQRYKAVCCFPQREQIV